MPGYPIVLELNDRRAVVVGLGAVGRRKVAGLVEAGAAVVGVDPRGAGGESVPGGVEVWAEEYRAEHLDGALLAFAAATEEVNRRVVLDAKERGILVNAASGPEGGDFTVPAVWREGPVTVAVATSGAGPALAAALRDRAAAAIGPEAAGMARLLAEWRPEVLGRVEEPEVRRRLLREGADPGWLDRLRVEGPEAVKEALRRALDEAVGGG